MCGAAKNGVEGEPDADRVRSSLILSPVPLSTFSVLITVAEPRPAG